MHLHGDLQAAIEHLNTTTGETLHRAFIIGGASLYAEAMQASHPSTLADRALVTRITSPAFEQCDTFMPDLLGEEQKRSIWRKSTHAELVDWVGFEVPEGIQEENGVQYQFQMWIRDA